MRDEGTSHNRQIFSSYSPIFSVETTSFSMIPTAKGEQKEGDFTPISMGRTLPRLATLASASESEPVGKEFANGGSAHASTPTVFPNMFMLFCRVSGSGTRRDDGGRRAGD
jgi:hypothetical protein